MDRVEIFKKCSKKIPQVESYLSGYPEIKIHATTSENVDISVFIGRGEGGILGKLKDNSFAIINVQEKRLSSHALIFVKSKFLKEGWGLFDPNGSHNLPFRIISKGKDVSNLYVEPNIRKIINYAFPNTINPGYCGTFGLMFMIYLKYNIENPNWLKNWIFILNKLSERSEKTNFGIELAARVQTIISVNSSNSAIVEQVYQLLFDIISHLQKQETSESNKKQKTNFGYKVYYGPRGGKFIIKNNKKIYM